MNKKRIARICWNTLKWQKPSGKSGKSLYKESYEYMEGFGYEEWLFDLDKLVNGEKYGWLEPIDKAVDKKYLKDTFDIALYTIDGATSKRYWAGEIKDVGVLDQMQRSNINKVYLDNGWKDTMQQDLITAGLNSKLPEHLSFNIMFSPKDIKIFDSLEEIPNTHGIYNIHRYSFLEKMKYPF